MYPVQYLGVLGTGPVAICDKYIYAMGIYLSLGYGLVRMSSAVSKVRICHISLIEKVSDDKMRAWKTG